MNQQERRFSSLVAILCILHVDLVVKQEHLGIRGLDAAVLSNSSIDVKSLVLAWINKVRESWPTER